MAKTAKPKGDSSANLGFEAKLWLAADKLRNNMDAAEYKHVVLGLIFLKYISDTFEEHRAKLLAGKGEYAGANAEDQDEYKAENVFWVPKEARWSHLQAQAKQPTIGKLVDDAMVALERDNPRLKGALWLIPTIPEEAREEALRKVLRVGTPALVQTNRAFHRMLRDGVPVEYPRPDGSIAGDHVRLVDFGEMRANALIGGRSGVGSNAAERTKNQPKRTKDES